MPLPPLSLWLDDPLTQALLYLLRAAPANGNGRDRSHRYTSRRPASLAVALAIMAAGCAVSATPTGLAPDADRAVSLPYDGTHNEIDGGRLIGPYGANGCDAGWNCPSWVPR